MDQTNLLTLEQELKLAIYKQKIYTLNVYNMKQHLRDILKQMMIKENTIKYFIKNSIT
uniref:Uncharacterized protein ycf18 n=1 Tax=Aglaothamnion neglectum TaxID=2765 RepID=YCF18_AGLNE|nr:RecName: Full=Uncharacterized protein ycf18 [Aglaothamnion neglectum]